MEQPPQPPSPASKMMDDNASKKNPFDNLSREELIKKCKALLLIAQKAKQIKNDVSNECESLKEQCQKLETQKTADKESLRMMQEFIDSLTEQKLNCATEIDTLKTQISRLKSVNEEGQKEIVKTKSEFDSCKNEFAKNINDMRNKLSTLDTENTSLKRQNNRLQDENETLIRQLDELEKKTESLEKLGLEQREALLSLENHSTEGKNDENSTSGIIETYKTNLQKSSEENLELKNNYELLRKELIEKDGYIDSINNSVSEIESRLTKSEEKTSELENMYNIERSKKEKLNSRLKYCKEKLANCKLNISQLHNSKLVLLKTVSDYSESVPKWQQDILNASKLLSEQLLKLESENIELKKKIESIRLNESVNSPEDIIEKLSSENDKLNNKLKSIDSEFRKLQNVNDTSIKNLDAARSEIDILTNNIKSLESEKIILINEKKVARETIQRIESEKLESQNIHHEVLENVTTLKGEIKQLKDSIDNLENEKIGFINELKSIKENKAVTEQAIISEMKDEIASLRSALVSVEEENKLLCESNEMLKSQLDTTDEQMTPEMRKIVEQNDLLQTDISKLQTKLLTFKNENGSLIAEVKESRQRLSELEALLQDHESIKGKISNYKSENAELLKEMKEINQVMKERGETISKQYMEISELNRKVQLLEEDLKKIKEVSDQKDDEIKKMSNKVDDDENDKRSWLMEKDNLVSHWQSLLNERDHIIISLQEDIEKLKQNPGNVSCDARSDSMSVSTISRVEETSQIKDLDTSFEERYSKLRMLTLKFKKRVNELTLQNKSLEETNTKLEQEKKDIETKLQRVGTAAKNVQSIQSEYDKVVDELEQIKLENNNVKKELQNVTNELEITNASSTQLKKDFEFSKMEKASLDMVIKELQNQLKSAKSSSDEHKDKNTEISKIQDLLQLKEAQLALEISQHQITKDALEKAKKDVKKKSVLSLEMEDYERSMKELTVKMEEDKKKIIQMESTIDMQQATIVSLKTQIKMLEDQLITEEKVSKEFKELFNNATENLKENENIILSKNDNISELERHLEDSKLQNEDLNLQLASVLGEKEKSALSSGQEKSELLSKLKKAEMKYCEIEEKLQIKIVELENVQKEFSNYKVRAQSVLRQNQTKDLSVEENLKEEMAALKSALDTANIELENLRTQIETVQQEKIRLATRCNELQTAITTAQMEKENMTEQYSSLLQKESQEQKNIKLQMSTLTQCYKKQIAELEESTTAEISKLRKELDFSMASLARAGIGVSKDSMTRVNKPSIQFVAISSGQNSTESGSIPSQERPEVLGEANVTLLEREEGEGSESTPSPSPTTLNNSNRRVMRGRREPMPLDQLLENGIPEEEPTTYFDGDVEQQYASALKQIETQNKRVNHLTELLSEAEKEVARRTQLGEALKEEVRRCQRALDRGLHHHNQEYLKNVIVKFLTLGAGDERSRLVPVLNTILTLSPEETHQLSAVAKGMDPNANNKGWGSYLPWTGNR